MGEEKRKETGALEMLERGRFQMKKAKGEISVTTERERTNLRGIVHVERSFRSFFFGSPACCLQ